jgi:hypothetical protein
METFTHTEGDSEHGMASNKTKGGKKLYKLMTKYKLSEAARKEFDGEKEETEVTEES